MNPPDTLAAPVIAWFRQDLRLADNPALAAAVESGRPIIPLYILDETPGIRPMGAASLWWLDKSLRALGEDLARAGAPLILRRGAAETVLDNLIAETGAGHMVWNRLYDAGSMARDRAIKARLSARGLTVQSFNSALLNEPWMVQTEAGDFYKVFTPYWRAARDQVEDRPALPPPSRLTGCNPRSERLEDWGLHPRNPDWSVGFTAWTPGEAGAHAALKRFLGKALRGYASGRDRPGLASVSRLSPHLHFGEIGPLQIWRAVQARVAAGDSLDGAAKFLSEIGWREFNHHLLFHNPDLARRNFRPEFDAIAWRDHPEDLDAWRQGRTGYPLVDAGMRELRATGYMHNRARMVAASFLVKDLMIDWRVGEAWFWDTLVDADLAQNAANWQWVAGSGADASPYFRVFNPIRQGERFDPCGNYIRRWIPELAGLSNAVLHAPWTARPDQLSAAGVVLGQTYPRPILDHAAARDRALAAYAALGAA
ncbi:deoxyribodipyrimidine photo-lyase [Caulobacter ginsengisoli]|uniref:Deoxyribodipyrimidine photo-lyase n=1 Tax=Caulobacter ginsengisoli TaxID=400775 RepID=A0ABU0IMD9_9CAUL|nr:deoxyribodipyrimidine photo-lyase [Caulobacter ginsengisoli]MDQ0463179.1 deoxyribodipyrimidine photo-lyase [Caulobacter ginsengisoli]